MIATSIFLCQKSWAAFSSFSWKELLIYQMTWKKNHISEGSKTMQHSLCCFYVIIFCNNKKKCNLGNNKVSFLCVLLLNINLSNKSEDGENKERKAIAIIWFYSYLTSVIFRPLSLYFFTWKDIYIKEWNKWRHQPPGLLLLLKISCLYLGRPSSLAGNTWGCVENRTFTEKIIKPMPNEIIYFLGR